MVGFPIIYLLPNSIFDVEFLIDDNEDEDEDEEKHQVNYNLRLQ